MYKLGLLGSNISHSKSQQMYEKILGEPVDYTLLDYQSEESIPFLESLFGEGYLGLSITYPFKKTFLNKVFIQDERVRRLNAINCLKKEKDKVLATNTDFLAAQRLLKNFSPEEYNFLVLGAGNMAGVFEECFKESLNNSKFLNRREHGDLNQISYDNLFQKDDQKSLLLINCCSRDFIFHKNLPKGSVFWDMNYSMPEHDSLVEKGIDYRNGLDLLFWQAKFACDFWGIKHL